MTDDRTLADLLGVAPASPDPGFRMDVLALVTQRRRRRRAMRHAVRVAGVFAAVGLAFPAAAAAGVTVADAQSVLAAFAAMGLAYFAALLSIAGPKAVLARSYAALRLSL